MSVVSKEADMSCSRINIPALQGWGCCACAKANKYGTFNGEQRDSCKVCGHSRCDNPSVRRIPIQHKDGIMIVPVRAPKKEGSN